MINEPACGPTLSPSIPAACQNSGPRVANPKPGILTLVHGGAELPPKSQPSGQFDPGIVVPAKLSIPAYIS